MSALLHVAFPVFVFWTPDRLIPWRSELEVFLLNEPDPGCMGNMIRSVSLMFTHRDMIDFFPAASVIGEFFRWGIRKNMLAALLFLA